MLNLHPSRKLTAILILLACCSACAPKPEPELPPKLEVKHYDPILSGEIAYVGKKGFKIMKKDSYISVDMDESDADVLKQLKKGDPITIRGKIIKGEPVKNKKGKWVTPSDQLEMYELELKDGKFIELSR